MRRDSLSDKQYLRQGIAISIDTVMIGALDAFERGFGELWGHGLEEEELTEQQAEFREVWREVREQILNRGAESKKIARRNTEKFSITRKKIYRRFDDEF